MSSRVCTRAAAVALALAVSASTSTAAGTARGANTWYAHLGSGDEAGAVAGATYLSQNLVKFGYNTYTLDEGWAEVNGAIQLDAFGRPTWNTATFPSGIPALAARLKGMGVTLGLWLVRGVPKAAAAARLPIAGTPFTADQAVRLDRNCSWSTTCLGSNAPSAPAAAYYASVAQQIASWGVGLVKIDCLWPNRVEGTPQVYFDEDVEAMTAAFGAAGLQLSLSPGISVSPLNGSYIAAGRRAAFYRIAEDVLDVYDSAPDGSFPQGVHQKFAKALEFESLLTTTGAASPDFDMLQVGRVVHSYSAGDTPSETRLTRDEQTTAMTLFCATGVPLIIGGVLPLTGANGSWTRSLLTNAEVLAIHNSSDSRASFVPPEAAAAEVYGWQGVPSNAAAKAATRYVTLYNAGTAPAPVTARLVADLHLPPGTTAVCVRDLWAHTWTEGPPAAGVTLTVPPHGARAALVAPVGSADCHRGLA